MIKVLALHSREDDVLSTASDYWQTLVPQCFPVPAFGFIHLYGADSSRNTAPPTLSTRLRDADVALVIGQAHGSRDFFDGYRREKLFTSATIVSQEVVGKIVHLFACGTAPAHCQSDPAVGVSLAEAFIAADCLAFIGYSVNIVLNSDPASGSVQTLVRCDAQIDISLSQGKSVAQAIADAKAAIAREMPAATQAVKAQLQAMSNSLCCMGDDTATLL